MKWGESITSQCRYAEIAERIWGEWNIEWEDSRNELSGRVEFLASRDGQYCFYEYTYGSCDGCDAWQGASVSEEQIASEMRSTAMWFRTASELDAWRVMLEQPVNTWLLNASESWRVTDLLPRVNAIRVILGMEPLARAMP